MARVSSWLHGETLISLPSRGISTETGVVMSETLGGVKELLLGYARSSFIPAQFPGVAYTHNGEGRRPGACAPGLTRPFIHFPKHSHALATPYGHLCMDICQFQCVSFTVRYHGSVQDKKHYYIVKIQCKNTILVSDGIGLKPNTFSTGWISLFNCWV